MVPPVLAGLLIAAAVVVPQAASATGKPALRPITPQALVAKALSTHVSTLSGKLRLTANLGIPDLSSITGGEGNSLTSFLDGAHTAQIWYGGPAKIRVAIPNGSDESDYILDGSTLWIWKSGPYSATKVALPPTPSAHPQPGLPTTPAQLAKQFLAHVGPTTAVKVADTAYVAGRPVYELVLSPKAAQSLIGQVVIAVDSSTGAPLRVQVVPRGSTTAALTFGFTQLSYARPAASNFDFAPPRGAKVRTIDPTSALGMLGPLGGLAGVGSTYSLSGSGSLTIQAPGGSPAYSSKLALSPAPAAAAVASGRITSFNDAFGPPPGCGVGYPPLSGTPNLPVPSVVGSGWTSVAVIPTCFLGSLSMGSPVAHGKAAKAANSALSSFLRSGTAVSGSWGNGHLVRTTLVDVLAVDNGPILVGAVTPATLEAAAAHTH